MLNRETSEKTIIELRLDVEVLAAVAAQTNKSSRMTSRVCRCENAVVDLLEKGEAQQTMHDVREIAYISKVYKKWNLLPNLNNPSKHRELQHGLARIRR